MLGFAVLSPTYVLTLLDLPEPLRVLAQATRFSDFTFGVATLVPSERVAAQSVGWVEP